MKMNKKKLAVVSLVLCIAAIMSMASLAWFTDTDSVTNTLSFVTDFSMDVYETEDDGKTKHVVSNETVGRDYTDLHPNQVIHKDPTVENKSKTEAQFIKVSVTVDKLSTWKQVVTAGSDLTSIFKEFDASAWTLYGTPVEKDDAITYTYILNSALAAGKTATLFKSVQIPSAVTLEQAKTLSGSKIIITADALQVSALGKTNPKDAWDLVSTK